MQNWPWANVKVQKGHTMVNIELVQDIDVENTTIKLQKYRQFMKSYTLIKVPPAQPKGRSEIKMAILQVLV